MKINTRGKSVDRQESLLIELATSGIQSEPDLSKKTGLTLDYVRKIIKELRQTNYVQKYPNPNPPKKIRGRKKDSGYHKPKRGRPNEFFGLSEEGIKFLMHKNKLEPKNFWKLLFHYFKPQNSFKISISDLIKNYEKNYLDFDRTETFTQVLRSGFLSPEADFSLSTTKEIIDKYYKDKAYPILFQLGYELMEDKEIQVDFSIEEKERVLKILTEMYLIIKDENYYRLTFLGFMLLLKRHQEIIEEKLHGRETDDKVYEMILMPHMITYHDFLPMIFGKWKLLRKYWSAGELFRFLVWVLDEEETYGHESITTDKGFQELFDDHKNLLSFNEEKLEQEYSIANEVFGSYYDIEYTANMPKKEKQSVENEFDYLDWDEEFNEKIYEKFEKENSLISHEITLLRLYLGFQDKRWTGKKGYTKFKVEFFEQVFPLVISFRFYTLLFQRTVFSYIPRDPKKWLEIFKTDKELVSWYSVWLRKFLKYNEIALKKRREFLNSLN